MKLLFKSLLVVLFLMSFYAHAADETKTPDETAEEEEPECD